MSGEDRNKEVGGVLINTTYHFLTSTSQLYPRKTQVLQEPFFMESDLPQVHQGHSSFFLFKSKPSGIPASNPSLFYILNMYDLATVHSHTVPYLSRFSPSWTADGALWTMLPAFFKEHSDCYYSQATSSCLRVLIYFCINFSHQNISISSANSLMELVYRWGKFCHPYLSLTIKFPFPFNRIIYFIPEEFITSNVQRVLSKTHLNI